MIDPVELIGKARNRLKLVAAARAALYGLVPAVTATVLTMAVGPATNELMLARWGVALSPAMLGAVRGGLIAVAVLAVATAAVAATIAYRRADDFVAAAEQIDAIVNARQEVLTFATLTDPSHPQNKRLRSGLFPLLRKRTAERLDRFDPDRAFSFDLAAPVGRGSALALAIVAILGLAMMALVRPPTPETAQAHRLREIARAIEASPGDSSSRALAASLRTAAAALENPNLPPEEKLKMLAEVTNELEHQPQPKSSQSSKSQSGRGNSSGKGDSGTGEGTGSGQGSGNGQGAGNGQNKNAPGAGQGEKKGQTQLAELQEELSKTKLQIENESAPKDRSIPAPGPGEKPGPTLKPGQKPNQPGAANQPTDTSGNKMGKQGENAPQTDKTGPGGTQTAKNDRGSIQGDTRLGQFPAPVRYERFYKPGEHGPPIDIRDARYVLFRLPTAAPAAGTGKTVLDTERPAASTPYANLPLKEQNLAATPDERQQIPPRYRDLIQ